MVSASRLFIAYDRIEKKNDVYHCDTLTDCLVHSMRSKYQEETLIFDRDLPLDHYLPQNIPRSNSAHEKVDWAKRGYVVNGNSGKDWIYLLKR